jgi:hypothetical protein
VQVFRPGGGTVVGGTEPLGPISNNLKLKPRSASDCPNLASPTERVYEIAVTTPAFTWAMPMLSGWDIGDACDDNHVTRVGVSIEDFRYELAPGASNGTLTYTVRTAFSDKDGYPGMSDRFQVDVLGINLLSPVVVD